MLFHILIRHTVHAVEHTHKQKHVLSHPFSRFYSFTLMRVLEQQKADLLKAVSFTNNGKSATVEKQEEVLGIVGAIEAEAPIGSDLFNNPKKLDLLDGTWYLQYTSPSVVGDKDEFPVSVLVGRTECRWDPLVHSSFHFFLLLSACVLVCTFVSSSSALTLTSPQP